MSWNRYRRVRPDHEFQVVWSQEHSRFDVCRNGDPTGAHATSKDAAVAIAIREARKEANSTGNFVVVVSSRDGRRVLEWDGFGERAKYWGSIDPPRGGRTHP